MMFQHEKYILSNNCRQKIICLCYNEIVISNCYTIKRKEVQYEIKEISKM